MSKAKRECGGKSTTHDCKGRDGDPQRRRPDARASLNPNPRHSPHRPTRLCAVARACGGLQLPQQRAGGARAARGGGEREWGNLADEADGAQRRAALAEKKSGILSVSASA